MSSEVLNIDGSLMEGGGQILRMSFALSALMNKPIKVYNIRAGRSSPGLRPQHLSGVILLSNITNGQLSGASVGSTEVTFYPGAIKGGKYVADPGTAGSIMLLFQVSFPCLLFAEKPSELHFKGGTNADMAPQIDEFLMIFQPIIAKMGAKFSCSILKRGYYPKGGGEVVMDVNPVQKCLQPIEMVDPGSVVDIRGRSFVAGVLPVKVSHGMADAACRVLRGGLPGVSMQIERLKEPTQTAVGNGSGIVIVAKTSSGCLIGGSALGKRGVEAEEVGSKAAQQILEVVKNAACVDSFVQDQLIIFMALAKGKSRVRIGTPSLHTKTAIFVAEMMTGAKFSISDGVVECDGIGLQR